MHWLMILIPPAALLGWIVYRRAARMPGKDAVELLRQGALLIDVRSGTEFSDRHLPRAINMPLDRIEELLPGRVADKRQPLLLHCHSGMRSSMAQKRLQKMGYTRVFNLGSYARAESLVKSAV
jgi:phage shock protein E